MGDDNNNDMIATGGGWIRGKKVRVGRTKEGQTRDDQGRSRGLGPSVPASRAPSLASSGMAREGDSNTDAGIIQPANEPINTSNQNGGRWRWLALVWRGLGGGWREFWRGFGRWRGGVEVGRIINGKASTEESD